MDDSYFEKELDKVLSKFKNSRFVHNGRSIEDGIDCLGFIILFYREFGIHIPNDDGKPIEEDWYKEDPERLIRAITNMNKREVDMDSLQPLDLVCFSVSRDIITHTGVMISSRKFAHMSPKSNFLISTLERHWKRRFRGAIRLIE